MSRIKLMWLIMITSSITGFAQYVLLGVTGTNHDPTTFYWAFWVVEFILWGIRSIVESICVGYIFMTVASRWQDRMTLSFFEIVILLEIATTIGVMTAAVGSSKSIYQMIAEYSNGYYFLWAFAMGAYAPLMMAGSGVAFRIQPANVAQDDAIALQSRIAELQKENHYGKLWQTLTAIDQARVCDIVQKFANGKGPELEAVARGELPAHTRSRAKKRG